MLPDGAYHLAVGSTEMGNGSVTSHMQLAAGVLGTSRRPTIDIINADTDRTPYDTGTFASTGTVVAGQAVELTAAALRDEHPRLCHPPQWRCAVPTASWRRGRASAATADLARRTHAAGTPRRSSLRGQAQGVSVAAHHRVQRAGHRVAVHRVTGEIRILHSVHAADIGRLINPMQCRGQIDGSIAMGIGWALNEHMVHRRATARWSIRALRNYRIPAFADTPRERGDFRRHLRSDRSARRQGAGRVRNQSGRAGDRQCASTNATGVRFAHLPLTPDRIFGPLSAAR